MKAHNQVFDHHIPQKVPYIHYQFQQLFQDNLFSPPMIANLSVEMTNYYIHLHGKDHENN